MNIDRVLKEIIYEYTDVPVNKISTNMNLKCDIGLDSFALINLITTIEDTFNINIPDNELQKFETLFDMENYIISSIM